MVDNQTVEQICVLIRSLDKDADNVYEIYRTLRDHFDIAGTIWSDDDIVTAWQEVMDDEDFEPTQEQIQAVKNTSYWNKICMGEFSTLHGFEIIYQAVEEVMAEQE